MAAPEGTGKPPHDVEEMKEAKPEAATAAAAVTGGNSSELAPGKREFAQADSSEDTNTKNLPKSSSAGTKKKERAKRAKVPAKFRTKRPTGTPKRPLSAYNYFFREQRNLMLEERTRQKETGTLPEEPPVDPSGDKKKSSLFAMMGKTIAKRWRELTPDQHEQYKELANEDLKRYRKEMDEFHLAQAKESRLSIERIYAKEEERNKQHAVHEASKKQNSFMEQIPAFGVAPGNPQGAVQQQSQQPETTNVDQAAFDRLFAQQFGRAPQQGNGVPADYLTMVRNQAMLPGLQQQAAPYMGYPQLTGLNPYALAGSSLPTGLTGLMPTHAANLNPQFLFGAGGMNGQQGTGGLPEGTAAGQQQQPQAQPPQGSYEALLSMNGAPAPTMEGDPLGASMNSIQQQQQEQQRRASLTTGENPNMQNNMAGMQQQLLQQQLQQQQQQQLFQQQLQQQQQLQYMNMNMGNGGGGMGGQQPGAFERLPQYNGNK
jgi:hypothetical protein